MIIINWFKKLFSSSITGVAPASGAVVRETKQYLEAIYKTELQIILKTGGLIVSDYEYVTNFSIETSNKTIESYNPAKESLESMGCGTFSVMDKTNMYHTTIMTSEIARVIYKPCTVRILLKEYQHD